MTEFPFSIKILFNGADVGKLIRIHPSPNVNSTTAYLWRKKKNTTRVELNLCGDVQTDTIDEWAQLKNRLFSMHMNE